MGGEVDEELIEGIGGEVDEVVPEIVSVVLEAPEGPQVTGRP